MGNNLGPQICMEVVETIIERGTGHNVRCIQHMYIDLAGSARGWVRRFLKTSSWLQPCVNNINHFTMQLMHTT